MPLRGKIAQCFFVKPLQVQGLYSLSGIVILTIGVIVRQRIPACSGVVGTQNLLAITKLVNHLAQRQFVPTHARAQIKRIAIDIHWERADRSRPAQPNRPG